LDVVSEWVRRWVVARPLAVFFWRASFLVFVLCANVLLLKLMQTRQQTWSSMAPVPGLFLKHFLEFSSRLVSYFQFRNSIRGWLVYGFLIYTTMHKQGCWALTVGIFWNGFSAGDKPCRSWWDMGRACKQSG